MAYLHPTSSALYLNLLFILSVIFTTCLTTATSDDDVIPKCDATKGICPDRLNSLERTTPRPRNRDKAHEDPDKYGLVPAFLIGASSVIIIYIISHCLYLHCYAKKKMRDMARNKKQGLEMHSSSQQTNSMLVTDIPSTSLAVRYDGAYGKAEIIDNRPYLIREENSQPNHELESSDSTEQPLCSGIPDSSPDGGHTGGRYHFPASYITTDDPGSATRAVGGPDDGSTDEKPPVGYVSTTTAQSPTSWTPVQAYMYQKAIGATTGEDSNNPQHTLVFVPVPYSQSDTKYRPMTSPYNTDHDVSQMGGGSRCIKPPLVGNASNMAVPQIVEDPASDQGSHESLDMEPDVMVHNDVIYDDDIVYPADVRNISGIAEHRV